jgi:hypothetical protein
MQDQNANRDQNEGHHPMSVAANWGADRAMVRQPVRRPEPHQSHEGEYDTDDGDVIAGVRCEEGRVDADVVATVSEGHRRDSNDVAVPGGGFFMVLRRCLARIGSFA